ncbi:MAG: GntR family transcriptional regulator [Erysipelothrix sp.]
MFNINTKDTTTPIFEQIIQQVAKNIALGILKPNEQIPTIRTLAKELGVNPNTVSKAYHECEAAGLIYSIPGKGSFVSKQDDGIMTLVDSTYRTLDMTLNNLKDLGEEPNEILKYIRSYFND